MKIAIFNDLNDTRKVTTFREILRRHEVYWITERFFSASDEGNLRYVRCAYPSRKLKEKSRVHKLLFEGFKLASLAWPERFLPLSADFPVFEHGFLSDIDVCLPVSDFALYALLKLRRDHGYRYKVVFYDAETIPFLQMRRCDMRHVWQEANHSVDHFLAWSTRVRNKELIEGVSDDRISVVFTGIDTGLFSPGPCTHSPDTPVLLTVGKIEHNKGIRYCLEADRELMKRGMKFIHVYIGTGKNLQHYRKLASRLGLDRFVKFAGFVTEEQLIDHYRRASVFILPSIRTRAWEEQFGIAIAEAMSCGLPVVSTCSGSIPEVLGNTGILVSERNSREIAGAVSTLLKDPALCRTFGRKARNRVIDLFEIGKVSRRTCRIIEKVAGKSAD
ncbi:MAG: glycosyltransferase family 4 protein [Candidatus Wallbacteria bacterium]|nr:glycosyltransferase family 4 protein [Candidatus Wallbacteria bacterium]